MSLIKLVFAHLILFAAVFILSMWLFTPTQGRNVQVRLHRVLMQTFRASHVLQAAPIVVGRV